MITGASTALNDPNLKLEPAARAQLAQSIETKAAEMSEVFANVLDLMRFEAGSVRLRRDWQGVDDLVGTALARLEGRLVDRPLHVQLPDDLQSVYVDAPLITQVLVNLLENAVKHTPAGTRIDVLASNEASAVRVVVEDSGPGLPGGDTETLFAKFHRGREESNTGGAGLGLAICRAIINAHGGHIKATQRPGGGARFEFTLPAAESTP